MSNEVPIAPSEDRLPQELRSHGVQFFESTDFLCEKVAAFASEGLAAGDTLLVFATNEREAALRRIFAERGVDLAAAVASGHVSFYDARAVLARIVVGSLPDWARFREVMGGIFRRSAAVRPTSRVRAYGEMVNLLQSEGNANGALALEDMWNRLQCEYAFSLLCAYALRGSYSDMEVRRICSAHGHVLSLEPEALVPGDPAVGHLRSLVAEISRRERVEESLRQSILELRETEAELRQSQKEAERLAAITAAIADAVTPEQISEAIVDGVAKQVGASSAGLWVVSGRAGTLVRSFGYSEASARAFSTVPLEPPARLPIVDALVHAAPVWIDSQEDLVRNYPDAAAAVTGGRSYSVGCVPVSVDGTTFGVLGFTFDGAPAIDPDTKRFLRVVAKHSGRALERLRLIEADRRARLQADLLYGLAASVIQAERVEVVYDAALDAMGRALGTNRSAVLIFDEDGVMRFKASVGLSEDYRRAVEGHSPWARHERSPKPILVPDEEESAEWASFRPIFRKEGIRALAFFPLVAAGTLLGKFMVYFDERRVLVPHETEMVQAIANHVAAAVARFAVLQELKETVRLNEMFAAILGHDLRNPLAAIMASAQVASRRDGEGRLAKPLGRILNSGGRMARMIDQLLDFARVRVESGIPLQPRSVDLVPLIRQTVGEIDDAHPEGTFVIDVAGEAGGVWDGDRLCQVFSNLIGNAVEHGTPGDRVRVRIDGTATDRVLVSIHNGGAIPEDVASRIFEPLTGPRARRERSRGLGLGLFITREIARAHGGSVEIHSSHADGTTFTVCLPRNAARQASGGE